MSTYYEDITARQCYKRFLVSEMTKLVINSFIVFDIIKKIKLPYLYQLIEVIHCQEIKD